MPTWKRLTAHSDLDSLLIKEKSKRNPNTHTHMHIPLYVQFKANTERMEKNCKKATLPGN